ncbi:MAG TPA: zf-TFIIB domain-containing protein [Herpetosiphonaceae bacterium]
MDCPICEKTELRAIDLEPALPAHQCPSCAGVFLLSSTYRDWVFALPPADPPASADPAPPEWRAEPPGAKCCPRCAHLLLRYRVSVEIPFSLDLCGHCNSVWLDAGEWERLKQRQLHDDIHHMFTDAWQRRLRIALRRAALGQIYAGKFGDADYAEIRRIRAWLEAHPHVHALRAYLTADDPYA